MTGWHHAGCLTNVDPVQVCQVSSWLLWLIEWPRNERSLLHHEGKPCLAEQEEEGRRREEEGGGGRRREEGEETGGGGRPGPAVTCVEGGRREGARTQVLQLLVTLVKYSWHLCYHQSPVSSLQLSLVWPVSPTCDLADGQVCQTYLGDGQRRTDQTPCMLVSWPHHFGKGVKTIP